MIRTQTLKFLRRVETLPLRIYAHCMRKPPRVQQEHLGYILKITETSKINSINPGSQIKRTYTHKIIKESEIKRRKEKK